LDRQAVKLGLGANDVDEILCDPETAPPAHVALEAALRVFYKTQSQDVLVSVIDRVREAAKTLTNTAMTRINGETMTRMIQREVQKANKIMDRSMAEMEAKQIADDGSTSLSPSREQVIGAT
jgi:limonene-1,2-epoxide hydrolase